MIERIIIDSIKRIKYVLKKYIYIRSGIINGKNHV